MSFDQLDQLKWSNCSIASMETKYLITSRYTMIITATICLITQNDHCFKIIVRFCYGFFASIIVHIVGNRTQIHHLVSSFFKYSSFISLVNFILVSFSYKKHYIFCTQRTLNKSQLKISHSPWDILGVSYIYLTHVTCSTSIISNNFNDNTLYFVASLHLVKTD